MKSPRMRVSAVSIDSKKKILLLRHVRPWGEFWVLPGGGLEYGESIEEALEREVREEINCECRPGSIFGLGELITDDRHVIDIFLECDIDVSKGMKIQHEEGISEARWVNVNELGDIFFLPPEIIPVIQKFCDGDAESISYVGVYDELSREGRDFFDTKS